MENAAKLEIISNIQNRIKQFKSNSSKNKMESNNLNFEINRDTLKLFFKNKTNENDNNVDFQNNKKDGEPSNNEKLQEIKNIANKPSFHASNLPKREVEDNQNIKPNKIINFEKENSSKNNRQINNLDKLKNEIFNGNKNNYNRVYEDESLFNNDYLNYNQRMKNKEKNQDYSLGNIIISNNTKHYNFNIGEIMKHKKLEKKEKSAPRISINENFLEKPLTDKKRENNIKNDNLGNNYITNTLNNFYTVNNNTKTRSRKSSNTGEKLQQLLMEFNINSTRNNEKRKIPYLNLNSNKNKENKYNKFYNQNNFKDINSIYEVNRNINNNRKQNYFNDVTRLDFFKDFPNKKSNITSESKSIIKEKMDIFYRELNKDPKSNINNLPKENYYLNKHYLNEKLNSTYNNENKEIISNKLDFPINKIIIFKHYVQNLNKEEMNKLPHDIQSELREIYNILNQKININY